jgi:hypothetical protein
MIEFILQGTALFEMTRSQAKRITRIPPQNLYKLIMKPKRRIGYLPIGFHSQKLCTRQLGRVPSGIYRVLSFACRHNRQCFPYEGMEGGIKQREMKQTLPPLHRERLVIPILFRALHVHICIHPGLGHHAWPSHRFSDLLRQIDLPKAEEEEKRLWLPEPLKPPFDFLLLLLFLSACLLTKL